MPIFMNSQCKNGALVGSIQYYMRNMRNIGIYVFIYSYLSRKPDGVSPQAIEPERKKRRNPEGLRLFKYLIYLNIWLRGQDLNLRPSGYEPDELPGCSTPRHCLQKATSLLNKKTLPEPDREGTKLNNKVLTT
jgi:hypothetical protein